MKNALYEWQEECLERWFANHGRGIIQAVTGSGKTLLALTAINWMNEKLGGNSSSLQDMIRGTIGLQGGSSKSAPDRKYMIYVINAARYQLAR